MSVKAKPIYRSVVATAWQTVRKYKYLWLWGLFASLLGNAGEYQFLTSSSKRIGSLVLGDISSVSPVSNMPLTMSSVPGLMRAFLVDPFSIFILLLIGLVVIGVTVLFIWLAIVSTIALVYSTAKINNSEKTVTIADGLAVGSFFFAPVLVTFVFGRLIVWFSFALIALFALLAIYDALIGLSIFFVAFIVLLPIIFATSFVVRYTIMFVVLKGLSLLESLHSAIELFKQNWLITVELALVLFGINSLFGLGLVAIVAGLVLPALFGSMILWQFGFIAWSLSLAVLSIAVFVPSLFVLGSILGAFQWAAWTHLFLKIQKGKYLSKTVRIFGRFLPNPALRFFRKI